MHVFGLLRSSENSAELAVSVPESSEIDEKSSIRSDRKIKQSVLLVHTLRWGEVSAYSPPAWTISSMLEPGSSFSLRCFRAVSHEWGWRTQRCGASRARSAHRVVVAVALVGARWNLRNFPCDVYAQYCVSVRSSMWYQHVGLKKILQPSPYVRKR